jgi:hypothetical protein
MVIIKTKYLSATNTKGARIKASANGFSATVAYPYGKNSELAHYEAVKWLVLKNGLDWDISNMGYGSDNEGYYFTFKNSVMEA